MTAVTDGGDSTSKTLAHHHASSRISITSASVLIGRGLTCTGVVERCDDRDHSITHPQIAQPGAVKSPRIVGIA
jgi:hypothetical protein